MAQFHWKPDEYLDLMREEVPRYEELQEQAIAAIPFAPERVLELGMGTGETTRRLIEAYPDAWVIGLDSSPDMVFRARENYDDVQLARMEDPLPDGPWDLVIGVLSVHHLRAEQKAGTVPPGARAVAGAGDRRRGQGRGRGDPDRPRLRLPRGRRGPRQWTGGEVTWAVGDLAVVAATYSTNLAGSATPAAPMAVPKKRTSSARRDKRRATHKAAKARLNSCPRCHSPRLPHRVCPTCGTYAGREIVSQKVVDPTTPASE